MQSSNKTLYEILKVSHNSNLKEIKSQYYKLCKLAHPDIKNSKESTEFHDIIKAYEILKDPIKRREYDRSLALIKYKSRGKGIKDFEINEESSLKNQSLDFWSKMAAAKHPKESETEHEERLEDIKVFRNRIIVISAIFIGYWISTFRNK